MYRTNAPLEPSGKRKLALDALIIGRPAFLLPPSRLILHMAAPVRVACFFGQLLGREGLFAKEMCHPETPKAIADASVQNLADQHPSLNGNQPRGPIHLVAAAAQVQLENKPGVQTIPRGSSSAPKRCRSTKSAGPIRAAQFQRSKLVVYGINGAFEAIDATDNGINLYDTDLPPKYVNNTHLSSRVGRLNLDWNDPDQSAQKENEAFQRAMALAGSEFLDSVRLHVKSWLPARSIVMETIAARQTVDPSGEILVLTKSCPVS
ncbi:hypothetical protein V8G54_010180 [Vigna mungo]|uniref:Uncharacterized protein n=1 Tax=Vigna mungo TaxID=3915 RepID=A0AAQ3NZJ8_VIGMU